MSRGKGRNVQGNNRPLRETQYDTYSNNNNMKKTLLRHAEIARSRLRPGRDTKEFGSFVNLSHDYCVPLFSSFLKRKRDYYSHQEYTGRLAG